MSPSQELKMALCVRCVGCMRASQNRNQRWVFRTHTAHIQCMLPVGCAGHQAPAEQTHHACDTLNRTQTPGKCITNHDYLHRIFCVHWFSNETLHMRLYLSIQYGFLNCTVCWASSIESVAVDRKSCRDSFSVYYFLPLHTSLSTRTDFMMGDD